MSKKTQGYGIHDRFEGGPIETADEELERLGDEIESLRARLAEVEAARAAAESNASKAGSAAYKLEGLLDRERKARVKAERERDRLREVLAEVLGHFWKTGHPGRPCLSTDWIAVETVAEWRAALTDTGPKECDHEPVMVGGVGDLLNPPNNRRVCRKCGRPM